MKGCVLKVLKLLDNCETGMAASTVSSADTESVQPLSTCLFAFSNNVYVLF